MSTVTRELTKPHKNGVHITVTMHKAGDIERWFEVEARQRPIWGAAYCKVRDRSLKLAVKAARAAMKG